MKTKHFWKIVLVCLCCIPFASCGNDSGDNIKEDFVKDIILEISNTVSVGRPVDGSESGGIEYMNVREKGTEKWGKMEMGSIKGFEYIYGHKYELKVRKTIFANPTMDGHNCKYRLLEILSDIPVIDPDVTEKLPEEAKFKFKMVGHTSFNCLDFPVPAPFDFLTYRILDHNGEYSVFNQPKFVEYYDSIVVSSPAMPDTYRVYWKEKQDNGVEEHYTSQWGSHFYEKSDFPIVLKGYKDGKVIYETSDTQRVYERDFLCIDWKEGNITIANPTNNGIYCVLDRRWEFGMFNTQEINGTLYTKIYAYTKADKKTGNESPENKKTALLWLLSKHLGNTSSVPSGDFKTLPEGVDIVETYQNATTRAALVLQHEDDLHLENYYVIAEFKY